MNTATRAQKYELVTFDKKGRRVRQATVHAPRHAAIHDLLAQAEWKSYTSHAEVWCDAYCNGRLVSGCDL
jgi:hypothetical protein